MDGGRGRTHYSPTPAYVIMKHATVAAMVKSAGSGRISWSSWRRDRQSPPRTQSLGPIRPESELVFAAPPQRRAVQDADRRPVHLIGENRQFAFFLRTVIDFDLERLKRLSKSAAASFVSASPSYSF